MFNLDMINVSIAQMRYFIVVVESNSITRAARLLNMTQSAISKNIISLEDYLGIQLFIRDKKRLILTDAGSYLYKQWVSVISEIDKSIDDARILQGGYANSINIGILSTHKPDAYIYPIIDVFKHINSKININVEDYPSEEIRTRLINGEIDFGFNVLYDLEELGGFYFSSKEIRSCPLAVGMLRNCPLAKKEKIEVKDLKEYNFVSISARYTTSYYRMIKSLCFKAGFQPNITMYTNNALSQLLNLRSEKDIFIMDKFYSHYDNPYFVWKPLENTHSGVIACWKNDNKKKGVKDFIDAIDEFTTVSEIF